jgi:hypothetical protein
MPLRRRKVAQPMMLQEVVGQEARSEPVDREKEYNERFLAFIKEFARIGKDSRIFPKTCNTCGRVYASFPEYIQETSPIGHGFEPYTNALNVIRTMQYRHCSCGSTLAILFTAETYPLLESFWEMLGTEAETSGKDLRDVVADFREQCNLYIMEELDTSD